LGFSQGWMRLLSHSGYLRPVTRPHYNHGGYPTAHSSSTVWNKAEVA
jgi:hypothetical protein